MKRLFVLGTFLVATGCYTYVPMNGTQPEMGREVRIQLSPSQEIDLGPVTVRDVTRVDGTVYRSNVDTVAIWSQWFHTDRRERYYANGHIQVLTRAQTANLEVRKLNLARTVLTAAGVLVAGAALFAFTADIGGGGSGDPGGDGVEAGIIGAIPIFRIPIP